MYNNIYLSFVFSIPERKGSPIHMSASVAVLSFGRVDFLFACSFSRISFLRAVFVGIYAVSLQQIS